MKNYEKKKVKIKKKTRNIIIILFIKGFFKNKNIIY